MKNRTKILTLILLLIAAAGWLILELAVGFPLSWLSLNRYGKEPAVPFSNSSISVAFTGDIMAGDTLRFYRYRYGEDHPYLATRSLLQKADFAIGNLEGPVATDAERVSGKRWAYKVDPVSLPALRRAGFDALTLANNHIRDCGNSGIRETIAYLERNRITPFGAGNSTQQAGRPCIIDKKGLRIAVFGFIPPVLYWGSGRCSAASLSQRPGQAGAAVARPRQIPELLKYWRKKSGGFDLAIAVIHLGDRYSSKVVGRYRQYLHRLLDAGLDGIICHGTHILAPVETYRGKPIAYGIGNYAFGSRNIRAQVSLIAVVSCNPVQKRISGVYYYPIYANNANPLAGHRSRFLQGPLLKRVQQQMITAAKKTGTRMILTNGVLHQQM